MRFIFRSAKGEGEEESPAGEGMGVLVARYQW